MSEKATKVIAKVVLVQDYEFNLVINKGSDDGVEKGDRYLVYGIGPELFDPDTNESLGQLEIVRGKGVVTHVQPRIATIRSIEKKIQQTRRIIREDTNPFSFLGKKVIEETQPDSGEELPFEDPTKGDYAKPI